MKQEQQFKQFLWRLYRRPERPVPWTDGGNLPWNEAGFSERMLKEHLDQSHGAASRTTPERRLQLDWLWARLALEPECRILDVTCGPGLYAVDLAQRECHVTGIDFGPAAIAHARDRAEAESVSARCRFVEMDVREMDFSGAGFDAALFLYGQLAVFTKEEAQELLSQTARALRPGARLCVELLNQDRVDKKASSWWFTDHTGLWGEAPYLCLGERLWYETEALSLERFYIMHLESARMDEITLCDQTYSTVEMQQMMLAAGFSKVTTHTDWAGVPLYDAREWVVYVAEK